MGSSARLEARDWYVKANARDGGTGQLARPFNSLQQVEAASQPGDTIYVLPARASEALDGGIQLKNRQRLIGLGPAVARAKSSSARATLTNTSGARYDGDIVRLARDNLVHNIHFDNAYRASVFGINADGARLHENLMTNDMAVHDLYTIEGPPPGTCGAETGVAVCPGEWPNGYILFAPQTNHFGAITLVSCGPNARVLDPRPDLMLKPISYCEFLVEGSGSIASAVDISISDNVIRDGNSDGIMLIADTGVTANFKVKGNVVKDLSQHFEDPSSLGITHHVVRSRALTVITVDASVTNLELRDFVASNLSPRGTFAADGVVFLACGLGPLSNGSVADVLVENPLLSGDTANGDSIEVQHRGSTHGVLNVDIRDAVLMDPASTNIKLIDTANASQGVYNVSVRDSVLSNINTAGNEDAQIRFLGTVPTAMTALSLTLKNVDISGVGRGLGIGAPVLPAAQAPNTASLRSLRILVERSSLSDLTAEAVVWSQAATAQLGSPADPPIIDLGGGPLGSRGRNRFVHNGDPTYVPEGANPAEIDRRFDGDIAIANARPAPANPSLDVYADRNYWGGGAPVISSSPGQDVYVPTGSNVTFSAPTVLTDDPR